MALTSGVVIGGRYVVRSLLGAGAQGEAYEVLDTHEGDVVALKLLSSLPPGGPWLEAQILRRLADPHILPIRNADVAAGQPYIVTELAAHGTLEGPLSAAGACGLDVDDVVRWLRHACHGVARAHDLRLVHNDIKPGNLFLNARGDCLVADFGFATLVPSGGQSTIPAGFTPETVAPEIASAWNPPAPHASICSDVYSLGSTAYWLLASRPANDFSAAPDIPAKMQVVATEMPIALRDIAPHVPSFVANVVQRAMSRAPADRHQSVTDLAAALGRRPAVSRRWRRTDEHGPPHLGCWRGEPATSGGAYLLCVEQGPRQSKCVLTAVQVGSGRRITRGCRAGPMRNWAQLVRASIRVLS